MTKDNWLYYDGDTADNGDNTSWGWGPNWYNNNDCSDITFYSYGWKDDSGNDIPLKFKQIRFTGATNWADYKWLTKVNVHLPFGSTITVVETPCDSTSAATRTTKVNWNYIYDV